MQVNKTELYNVIYSIFALLSCVLGGRILANFSSILPSSLYGLILFTLMLHLQIFNADRIKKTVAWGMKYMGVCFVPAGVGIINHFELLKQYGIAIVAITFATTFMLITIVGLHYQRYEQRKKSLTKT